MQEATLPNTTTGKEKYDAMIEECEKHLDIPIYINSTLKEYLVSTCIRYIQRLK